MVNRLTDKIVKERFSSGKYGNYTLLSAYTRSKDKFHVRHGDCEHDYWVEAGSFFRGSKCPYCRGVHKPTDTELADEVNILTNGEYKFVGHYLNSYTKTKFLHTKCGNIWETSYNDFRRYSCPFCAHKTEGKPFKEWFNKHMSNDYDLLTEYKSVRQPVKIRCHRCHHVFEARISNLRHGSRCPYCQSSYGEQSIVAYLERKNISYEYQKTFPDCRYRAALPFDFFVNNKVLIEFQGRQHYDQISVFDAEESFELRQLRDSIKCLWAKHHHVPLMLIPFVEQDNLDEYLDKFLPRYLAKAETSH